jgi:glycosyltransferase involved in cell wall biosynthesis
LEAMACGCSVVGSRVGGIPELIDDGASGLLFESRDVEDLIAVLTRLILEPALRHSLGARAAAVARERFSMEVNAQRYETLYRTLLGRKGIIAPQRTPTKEPRWP